MRDKTFCSIFLVLIIALAIVLPSFTLSTTQVNAQTVSQSSMLQYEWPTNYGDTSLGWYTAGGPGPTNGDILWTSQLGTLKQLSNGYLFLSGARVVDPFTGKSIYNGTWGSSNAYEN
jgi:hypothetical protein